MERPDVHAPWAVAMLQSHWARWCWLCACYAWLSCDGGLRVEPISEQQHHLLAQGHPRHPPRHPISARPAPNVLSKGNEGNMSRANIGKVLFFSLVLNAVALGVGARTIYLRGGWEYVKDRWHGAGGNVSLGSDEMQYLQRETLFERMPLQKGNLVFLGDSHIAGCEWAEFFPGALNRGIGGDTSAGVLKRISSITQLQPRVLFVQIGSNDLPNLGLSPEETVANVGSIVAEIRRSSPATVIVLQGNLPTWSTKNNLSARKVNRGLETLADGKRIVYVDLYTPFLEGTALDRTLTYDGNHLNGDGYLRWKQLIEPHTR